MDNREAVLVLAGEFDLGDVGRLETAAAGIADDRVVDELDLEGVTFMDVATLRAIERLVRSRTVLRVRFPQGHARRLLGFSPLLAQFEEHGQGRVR